MLPYLRDGQIVIGSSRLRYRVGDIVIIQKNEKEIIKRLKKIEKNRVWIEGDNRSGSTDSRQFGWIDKSDILGGMKYKLPLAVAPPKLRAKHGIMLGWGATVILIIFSLVHLFRIDTFVPEMARVFNNSVGLAFLASALIVTMEVFALPFLMRVRLSPLAQYVSGAFVVMVPLFWLLVSVWTFGLSISTAQLGEFVSLPSSWVLLAANIVWLLFSYYVIWALGYDRKPNEKQTFVTQFFSRLSK